MNKLALKLSLGAALTAASLFVMAGSAFAANTCTVSSNGVFSHNKCVIVDKTSTKVVTVNKAFVGTFAVGVAATGGNSASFNTGGSTTVTSGSATVTTVTVNVVNSPVSL